MLNRTYTEMLKEKDLIFEIFQYARKLAAEIGRDQVYDFSLGNPSVPAPECVNQTIRDLVSSMDPLALHGYSPGLGIPEVKADIVRDLNQRYGSSYSPTNLFMTAGAAGALAHALRAVSNPGEEIITFAPCFSEYKPYVEGAGLKLTILPADTESFQVNFQALTDSLNENVAAVLINSPNNPSGIVYSTDTVRRLASILEDKEKEYGHPIYLISDEPYRDILFKGVDGPYIANLYKNTLTCYSYSKSLSLPGERIGYLAVNPDCAMGDRIIELCPQISRTTGHNGAAALFQRTVALTAGQFADLPVYEENMELLYQTLTEYGYRCVKPGGTFYMFPRSLEPDSIAFCKYAREKYHLMLVPGDIFGCPGHFRIAYCVPTDLVRAALPVFKALAQDYAGC